MKTSLVTAAFLLAPNLFAAQPPDIGHYKGLAFSSATDRHPIEIEGGNLVKCTKEPAAKADITRCEVEKGSVVVTGTDSNNLNVKLTRVAVLRAGTEPMLYYYFRGTAELKIGSQDVVVPVEITLSSENVKNRLRGTLELPEQAAKTTFEAYLVP